MALLLVTAILGWCTCVLSFGRHHYDLEHLPIYFENFKEQYNKEYSSEEEEQRRFQIFKQNLKTVNQLNRESNGVLFGITPFMDLTKEEFSSSSKGYKKPEYSEGVPSVSCENLNDDDIPSDNSPDTFDWRTKNIVTDVKNQRGDCGSCWAFSTIGNVESQYALKYNQLESFSEQQLIDCDKRDGGCEGGDMATAMLKLIEDGGSEREQVYPYQAIDGECKFNKDLVKAKVIGCKNYSVSSEDKLKDLLYTVGPITIAIQADYFNHFYHGGIVNAKQCNIGQINHAVLAVGYGSENGKPFWIIKNSWGTKWGERGYFRIERDSANACSHLNTSMATVVIG